MAEKTFYKVSLEYERAEIVKQLLGYGFSRDEITDDLIEEVMEHVQSDFDDDQDLYLDNALADIATEYDKTTDD